MTYRIREAQPDDFETLWGIDQQCFPPGISYSRVELRYYIQRRSSFTLVADSVEHRPDAPGKHQAEILGFVVAESRARERGHIITIDVLPSARRFGIGSALMNAAEERLRAAGCRDVLLETAVDNTPAYAFYKRHHYELLKTIPRYYQNSVDAFLLRKQLA